jgi:DNA-binding LacI/PurR family transcriptional regulator
LTEETQRRVLDAAQQVGYLPRVPEVARVSLKRKRHIPEAAADSIGFLFFARGPKDFVTSHTFYAPVLAGAQAEASTCGMNFLLHTVDFTAVDAPLPRMIVERAVGGLLLVGAVDRAIVDKFAVYIPKVVLVDNLDELGAYESVVSDGFGGGLTATRHLVALGHKRIGFIATRRGVPTFQDRQRGYWCGLLEAGIAADPSLSILPESEDDNRWQELGNHLIQVLTGDNPPTALVAANDSCAAFAQWKLRGAGIRVPDDVSLVGFDDVALAATTDPPLTTVRVDREAMGRAAVRRLATLLKSSDDETEVLLPPGQYKLPVELIVRESCRPLVI